MDSSGCGALEHPQHNHKKVCLPELPSGNVYADTERREDQ